MQSLVISYYRTSSKLSVERFYTIVQFKSLRALADPGEAVGLLAAQVRFENMIISPLTTVLPDSRKLVPNYQVRFIRWSFLTNGYKLFTTTIIS